jgi:heat shock protein HslJ
MGPNGDSIYLNRSSFADCENRFQFKYILSPFGHWAASFIAGSGSLFHANGMRIETWLLASLALTITATSALSAKPAPPRKTSGQRSGPLHGKPTKRAPRLPSLTGTSWAIQSINGKPVSHPEQAEISFTSKTLSATVGCNRMSGPYEIGKVEYIMTDQMISTLIGCPVGLDEEERVLSQLLSDDPRMQYASKPSEPVRLRLSSGRNEAIIVERWFIGLD